ncbi:MarR family winged helix-turn-helix transcriptional regulator [Kitasatospora sp. NPDC056446]|uniref:MarR family winged helix-turn-helix transcriptional regulator n=1 Tax=Kitasatospora sp. NPDC056446 TaxID=3345819 RepID=UPI003696D14F
MPDADDDPTASDLEGDRTTTSDLEAVLASLAYLLTRSQEHERRTARAGITAARSDVYLLRALAEAEGASRVSDLADRLMVKPSHVTRQIDRLQGQHLVERTQDALDRRARQVAITADGRELLDRLKQANIIGLAEALDGVPEPDVAATVGVLRHLVDRYVQRVRTTMLSGEDLPPGCADDDPAAVRAPVQAPAQTPVPAGPGAHDAG